jgi:hypothetical protein
MTATVGGLCSNWTTKELVKAIAKYADLEDTVLDLVIPVASEILFMLSGQQWPGECGPDTARPCCGHAFDRCTCSAGTVLDIGIYPIIAVTEIKIDGQTLPTSSYSLWDNRYIRRTDLLAWPCCQDLRLPTTQPNTFSVTYTYGYGPSAAGIFAATIFAGELAYAVLGDEENCRLPRGLVSSIVRQGVTVAFRNSETSLSNGFVGLQEVDQWLATIPRGLRSAGPSQVFVPEFHKRSTRQT